MRYSTPLVLPTIIAMGSRIRVTHTSGDVMYPFLHQRPGEDHLVKAIR
jgi:hypothetical protein